MTVNVRGGAPGGIGKNVFYRVSRGQFVLYDPAKHGQITKGETIKPSVQEETEEVLACGEKNATEDEIRGSLMKILYSGLGKVGTWRGSGRKAFFDLRDEFEGYKCFAERRLSYELPTGYEMGHASDILITNEEKHISIEIKHRSATTDQFKCRSYDMIHLKKSYGNSLLGIVVYVKSGTGISVEHAKSICYSFDYFFGIPSRSKHTPTAWDELMPVITKFLRS